MNTLLNALVSIKEKIHFMLTQDYVYILGCVDCDAFFIGGSREIPTPTRECHSYTKNWKDSKLNLQ